jgi:hypothetical protein
MANQAAGPRSRRADRTIHSRNQGELDKAVAQPTILDRSRLVHRSGGVTDPLMKAEDWRSRADELRELAGRTKYQVVRAALLNMAETFEGQAANLTTLALKLRMVREHGAAEAAALANTADPDTQSP